MIQTTLRDYLQNTEDALSAGRIDDALDHCQHILSSFPESLETQRLLGEIYMAQGQLDEAQQSFDWVLTNDPENVIAYCNRALISERISDLETALDCYQQAYELSRGNSHIRQEFNQLSARLGQQGFMFSRAGLARLYMRGDLLSQAILEWEAVLNTSPDRLDARTGLLEAYWREGLYEQAEQLATQLLESVPGCLKALLLLAHITSGKNMSRAKELLQRAEALDPEMIMARELFGDLIASQPNDPFLGLLKKGAVLLDGSIEEPQLAASKTPAPVESVPAAINSASAGAAPVETIFGWSSPDTLKEAEQNYQPALHSAARSRETSSADAWAQNGAGVDSWQTQSGITQKPETGVISEAGSEKTELPTPPAWLDTLTKRDRQQASGEVPTVAASSSPWQAPARETIPATPAERTIPVTPREAEKVSSTFEQEDIAPFPFAIEDGDVDMGWPEWLKSLGAEAMESPLPAEAAPATWAEPTAQPAQPEPAQPLAKASTPELPAIEHQAISESEAGRPEPINPWLSQLTGSSNTTGTQHHLQPVSIDPWAAPSAYQAQSEPANPWLSQLSGSASPQRPAAVDPWATPAERVDHPEATASWLDQLAPSQPEPGQHLITTLENLEQDLRSQGFIPLAPGALSTIAQETQSQEPSLSSALAQLGNFEKQPDSATDVALPAQPKTIPIVQPAEPLWPATPAESAKSAAPASSARADSAKLPAYRADALLENELETTMKRPAFRLQPMQRGQVRQEHAVPGGRGQAGEQQAPPKTPAGELTYKDRLLRGYQYQLAGAYDDAMQEYRIIIRSAPELLGEVISNTRALLKLAPKYSAGYRVLGDAYMRQGEYLQAMEAYNKALTMAKKAKGQSN